MSAVADTDLWSLCPAVYWCGTPLDVRDGEEFYDQGDVEKGRALLASSGYDGEVVVLISPNNVAWVAALGDELGNVMESIGLTVERPYADFLIFSGMLSRTELYDAFPVWYGYWNGGTPLNDQALSLGNRFVAHDDDLANLQEAYASETDTAKRLGIVRDISRRRLEEAGMILLGTFPHMLPVASGLKGVQLSALPYYGNAWLER
ncbi:MAG: hypothetical protein FJ317_08690 [SAR202 cluster bacterium]|nr:hypothetical protein [SAR202 cluster bacterium]